MKRISSILLSGVVAMLGSSLASGQDILAELYGQGVHAYFAGNLDGAEQLLNQAIDSGSQDPRVYYFRGLTQARRGGAGAGQADYQTGAEIEATGKRSVPSDVISKSLTRIQGAQRLEIEKARNAARLAAKIQQALMRRAAEEAAAANPSLNGQGMAPIEPGTIGGGLMQGNPQDMPKANTPPVESLPPANAELSGDKAVDPFKDDAPAPATEPAPATQPTADDPFK